MKGKWFTALFIVLVLSMLNTVSYSSEISDREGTVIQDTECYTIPGAKAGIWSRGTSLHFIMEVTLSYKGEEYYFCRAEDGSVGYVKADMIEVKEVDSNLMIVPPDETEQLKTNVTEQFQVENGPDSGITVSPMTEEEKEAFRTVGRLVSFGHYEQDGDSSNGQEKIKWRVLDVQDGKSLLLSDYLLDAKPYNTELADVTWETCSLRKWLNQDFMNVAFNDEEQRAILTTSVDNSTNQGYSRYGTDSGNNTLDKIFLLSYHEVFDIYFSSDNSKWYDRTNAPTDYAIAQGAYDSTRVRWAGERWGNGWWWLRSPGNYQNYATFVNFDGSCLNNRVNYDSGCVRPAFWINLESDIR